MTATDANGCDTTVSMAVVPNCTVGMEEQVTTYVHIYPNPSSDIVNIELMDNADLEVYSISGQLLLRIENVYGKPNISNGSF
jgi:hypothetical protein